MQMGVTGCKLCYFFVWTPYGYILTLLAPGFFDLKYPSGGGGGGGGGLNHS